MGGKKGPQNDRVRWEAEVYRPAIERYPVQLHELERNEYLDMKRRVVRGQQLLEAQLFVEGIPCFHVGGRVHELGELEPDRGTRSIETAAAELADDVVFGSLERLGESALQ